MNMWSVILYANLFSILRSVITDINVREKAIQGYREQISDYDIMVDIQRLFAAEKKLVLIKNIVKIVRTVKPCRKKTNKKQTQQRE